MPKDSEMSIISHLEAFKSMLLKCIASLGILFIPSFCLAPKAIELFISYIIKNHKISLNYFSPIEVFLIQIKVALLISFIFALPYILKQVWNFFAPALYENEIKFIKSIVLLSLVLFVLGAVFSLFIIIPLIINFGLSFSSSYINPLFGISNVISLSMWMILAFGLMFQLPLITYSLISSDIISYSTMKNLRPYVIVGILIFSAFLTPPDIISQILLFVPTYFLFEAGLMFSRRFR